MFVSSSSMHHLGEQTVHVSFQHENMLAVPSMWRTMLFSVGVRLERFFAFLFSLFLPFFHAFQDNKRGDRALTARYDVGVLRRIQTIEVCSRLPLLSGHFRSLDFVPAFSFALFFFALPPLSLLLFLSSFSSLPLPSRSFYL